MTAMQPLLSSIQETIGHVFRDTALLQQALIHASRNRKTGKRSAISNERLEFLGDRVLGLVMAERLYASFPLEDEGALTRRHASLVRKETLAAIAEKLGMRSWLHVDNGGEALKAKINDAMLADACEALIAAMYLDGGLEVARRFILEHWSTALTHQAEPPRDSKTALQEWAQKRGMERPVYAVVERSGPAHAPHFIMSASLGEVGEAQGAGGSKQAAEQQAAGALLAHLSEDQKT